MKTSADLGKDPVSSLVLRLAIPAMIAQFVNVLYSIIDRMYIGHIPGTGALALAGVGVCGPIVTLLSSFGTLVGLGGSILLGIRMGEGNLPKARQILSNSFLMLCGFSVILTTGFLFMKDHLLIWFGASEITFPYADTYMTIYTAGTFFALMAAGLNYFINCQGFPVAGMMTVLIGAVSNIILDPVFIFLFHMDVAGAAIATVISQMASCAFALLFLFSKKVHVRISFGNYSRKLMLNILYLGMSPFLILATDSILLIVMNTVLQKYGGPEQGDMLITCATIVQSYMLLITSPMIGISGGTQAIISYNYGARQTQRVQKNSTYKPEADASVYHIHVYPFPFYSGNLCPPFHLQSGIHGLFCLGNQSIYHDDHSLKLSVCVCRCTDCPGTDQNRSFPFHIKEAALCCRNYYPSAVFPGFCGILCGTTFRCRQRCHLFRSLSADH